jgi:hypothetical protein
LVTSCGRPSTGPRLVTPTNPAVLVPTPAIGGGADEISST